MTEMVRGELHQEVLVVSVDNPPVNALSPGIPEAIADQIRRAEEDSAIRAIVLIGAGRTFIAGADIKQLQMFAHGSLPRDTALLDTLKLMDSTNILIVCAIHGTALGGGLEVAQACHYRVAAVGSRVGQPEVKLGIIPGAAGTQRLPRLVGVATAAELCASGRLLSVEEASEYGLIDLVVEGDLLSEAIQFARNKLADDSPLRRTSELTDRLGDPEEWQASLAELRQRISSRARGAVAGLRAIDAVQCAATTSFDDGCQQEATIFNECLQSDECRALIHVFFGERAANKVPGLPSDAEPFDIEQVAVVGAGTMGRGIAMVYLNSGFPVQLKEVDEAGLDSAIKAIQSTYDGSVKRGRITQSQADDCLSRLNPTTNYDGFENADLVVEAVFEGLELKQQVFTELTDVTRPDAILATNTSTLDIDAIAGVTDRPEMVIGHHFFSPANVMRLLEIVRGEASSDRVIATSMGLSRKLKKIGVLVGNCRGFVGNRMFGPFMREAEFLLEEGATVAQVDSALIDFGMAMGPLAVGDLAGLDVAWRIRKEYAHLEPSGARQQTVADRLCEDGHYGQKTGRGWYLYEQGNRFPTEDPSVQDLIQTCAAESGITRRTISDEEIRDRTLFALANEGARILEEGFASRASDIDIIYLNGYGFPPHRGGPMWHADVVGLPHVLERVEQFHSQHGDNWAPAPLLIELASNGGSFSDLPC
jgi:3-hydroxyacyl-CoA dehydrogenase